MSKFNTSDAAVATKGVITSEQGLGFYNHEGVPAFGRDDRSDLFLLGVTNFVREETFYETASERDNRFRDLVHSVTKTDPAWVRNFVRYLREDANMRSAAVVAAVEYVRAGGQYGRRVIDSACLRADEPGEVLAYYTTQYGRTIPIAIKRGVADAARRLYNQWSYLKYDSDKRAWRWADVLQVAHVKPGDETQSLLFQYILDSYYKGKDARFANEALPLLGKNRDYREMDKDIARAQLLKRPEELASAGFTWEALSSFGPMDKDAWEAMIPSMGYMALLRNLRNFDQAGVSDAVADKVIAKLTDPEEVKKSRQLVFRFYSAYVNAPSLRWGRALETAMDLSVQNVPSLGGKTLVLVDLSGSMTWGTVSGNSKVRPADIAALVGAALAKSGQDVTVVPFATSHGIYEFPRGGSILKATKDLTDLVGQYGGGTNVGAALGAWDHHNRVIILSDMQTTDYVNRGHIPTKVPIYGFNLQGYSTTVIDTESNQYELGGFTDNTFAMIKALESGRNATWPWDTRNA